MTSDSPLLKLTRIQLDSCRSTLHFLANQIWIGYPRRYWLGYDQHLHRNIVETRHLQLMSWLLTITFPRYSCCYIVMTNLFFIAHSDTLFLLLNMIFQGSKKTTTHQPSKPWVNPKPVFFFWHSAWLCLTHLGHPGSNNFMVPPPIFLGLLILYIYIISVYVFYIISIYNMSCIKDDLRNPLLT